MKRLYAIALLFLLGIASPSYALDRFVVAGPVTFSVEKMLFVSALERHSFEKARIALEYVPGATMELMTQRMQAGELDAHTYPAPAWQANKSGVGCFTMVLPIVSHSFFAVVATTPEWKKVKAAVFSGFGNFASQMLQQLLDEHGLGMKDYEPQSVKGFTSPRLKAMLDNKVPTATMAAEPLYEYIRRTEGVHVLMDIGTYPVADSGLVMQCEALKSEKRRDIARRVVKVLHDEKQWILDEKASDPRLLPWVRAVIEKDGYDKKYGTSFEGRPVKPDSVEPAKRMLEHVRRMLRGEPSDAVMENTVKVIFGSVPSDFKGKYYDFRFVPQ
jgi:ABC-type nitrate/sulfonate/bicarbonate transport system substrate-binding protein